MVGLGRVEEIANTYPIAPRARKFRELRSDGTVRLIAHTRAVLEERSRWKERDQHFCAALDELGQGGEWDGSKQHHGSLP